MAKFNPGDQVLIDGNLVAEIHTYDEENNRIVYVHTVGGGTNTVYGHISQTRVQHLIAPPQGADEPAEDGEAELSATEPVDELTTSESL